MSDFDLPNPYDPDAFERRQPPIPRPRPPTDTRVTTPADEIAPRRAESRPEKDPGEAQKEPAAPVPWKAAASSVPKLRQQPVTREAEEGSFQGFAQDELPARGAAMASADPESDAEGGDQGPSMRPLSVSPPAWEVWVERVRAVPVPIMVGSVIAAIVLVVALPHVLHPGQKGTVSLARIRQNPEAFDGRQVAVRGRAGETFQVGGSYVFNLRQGRDTIVVYSRTRRPALHEDVRTTGMLSIGYLDGMPRLALIEDRQTP